MRADATQTTPLVLGTTAQQQDRVSGYSEILIDTRNVSVNYTDLEGQTYTDVLRQSDDGNYFFNYRVQVLTLAAIKQRLWST